MNKYSLERRQKDVKEPNDIFLVLTEDTHSSKFYIEGLIRHLELNSRRFELRCPGSSPKNIKEAAKKALNDYDQIFCIFDKDSHDAKGGYYTKLLNWTASQSKVFAINSVPCFEYWLYLHFSYTDKSIKSSSEAEKLLRTKIKKYEKGKVSFSQFRDGLSEAVKNSKKSIKRYESDDGDNPITRMGEFVDKLQAIKNKP